VSERGGLVASFERGGFVLDAGIRAIENSGIGFPMLRQLGIDLEFLPSTVSASATSASSRCSARDG